MNTAHLTGARSVVVLGGGVAGLATALALARDGHRVTLVERDEIHVDGPLEAVSWRRAGIPHFMQPHAFTPRGRQEMRLTFPDVFDALIEAGAWDLDLRPKMKPVAPRADDDELVFLAVRRPLIEWALRRALLAESNVRVVDGVRATGLVASRDASSIPHVEGAETTAGTLTADLVIDAMGRRSPAHEWIAAIGGQPMDERVTDCAIIYYCRYYRVRDGRTLPDGPAIPSPRGDLGYGVFSTFPGDNGTFAALVAIPPGDRDLKILRDARAFEAAIATMPALDAWTNGDTSEPITDVLPMGSLQNTIRSRPADEPSAFGLISIGDSVCHTDPVASLGLSFVLIHARELASALRDHRDLGDIADAFEARTRAEMDERYAYVSAIDATRSRMWAGERIDYAHADGGAYPFFSYAGTGVSSLAEADVARMLLRRNYFLDPLAVLDDDPAMQRRLETFYTELAAMGRPPAGPPRDELLAVMRRAIANAPVSV